MLLVLRKNWGLISYAFLPAYTGTGRLSLFFAGTPLTSTGSGIVNFRLQVKRRRNVQPTHP